jgi:hypothetical protein
MNIGGVAMATGSGAQPVEPRPQLLVEDRNLAVEHQAARRQLSDCRRNVVKAAGVVAAVPADQVDAAAVLVRQDAPAIDLLLVDPAVAVEGRADERGGHRRVLS